MSCKWTPDGHMTREHQPDCRDTLCGGCEPCSHDDNGNPVRHCRIRKRCAGHLEPGHYACPRCLSMIRANLHAIVDQLATMSDEATEKGVNSEAANLAGPHASPPELKRRLIWHSQVGMEVEEPDPNDPVTVLAERERWIREDLGHDDLVLCSPTIAQSVAYLEWVLTDLARDESQVLILADLMTETHHLRTHLDSVRHDEKGDEEGAPCTLCPKPAPKLRKRWMSWDKSGASDRWVCPANDEHRWTEAEYRQNVGTEYLKSADRLTLTDMALRTEVAPGTLRRWASVQRGEETPRLKACGRSEDGRKVYKVSDVEGLMESRRVS